MCTVPRLRRFKVARFPCPFLFLMIYFQPPPPQPPQPAPPEGNPTSQFVEVRRRLRLCIKEDTNRRLSRFSTSWKLLTAQPHSHCGFLTPPVCGWLTEVFRCARFSVVFCPSLAAGSRGLTRKRSILDTLCEKCQPSGARRVWIELLTRA